VIMGWDIEPSDLVGMVLHLQARQRNEVAPGPYGSRRRRSGSDRVYRALRRFLSGINGVRSTKYFISNGCEAVEGLVEH